jgi:hypothetical protein
MAQKSGGGHAAHGHQGQNGPPPRPTHARWASVVFWSAAGSIAQKQGERAMLFSPHWDRPQQHSWGPEATLENFALWLQRQPPRQRYQWEDPENCAVTQWLESLGYDGERTPAFLSFALPKAECVEQIVEIAK